MPVKPVQRTRAHKSKSLQEFYFYTSSQQKGVKLEPILSTKDQKQKATPPPPHLKKVRTKKVQKSKSKAILDKGSDSLGSQKQRRKSPPSRSPFN